MAFRSDQGQAIFACLQSKLVNNKSIIQIKLYTIQNPLDLMINKFKSVNNKRSHQFSS